MGSLRITFSVIGSRTSAPELELRLSCTECDGDMECVESDESVLGLRSGELELFELRDSRAVDRDVLEPSLHPGMLLLPTRSKCSTRMTEAFKMLATRCT